MLIRFLPDLVQEMIRSSQDTSGILALELWLKVSNDKKRSRQVDDDRRQRSLKARGVYLPRNLASIIAPVPLFYFLECIFIGLPMVNQRCILQAGVFR